MKLLNGQRIREQRGVVLIVSLLVLTILSVLGLAFLATARTEDTIASNYRNHTAAFYAAEAGVESGVASLKATLRANPNTSDADLAKIVPAALTDPNYTFSAFQVRRIRPTPYLTTIDSGPYTGLNGLATAYEVSATVAGPRGSRARLVQRVNYVQIPLFQFMAFYGRGLDISMNPGPVMTLNGRIHTNSNMHLADYWSGAAEIGLYLESYVTAAGKINRHYKESPSRYEGNPQIKDAAGNYQKLDFDHAVKNISIDGSTYSPSDENYWRDEALKRFGGRVQDSAHGVQEIIPPIPDALYDPMNADKSSHLMIEKGSATDSQALKDAKIYYQADLRIVDDKAYDKAGNTVNINGCKDANNKQAVRKESFWDNREKITMQVTQIDVGALTACGVMPKSGIVYASAKPGSPNKGDGVRLVNGAQLPTQGLTIVSDNPVYVMGDYNTKDKNGNLRTTSTPLTDLVPAAVLGDAVTILSNNWEKNGYDKKGDQVVEKRPASATTVNAALAMGPSDEAVPGSGNGNGGLQNLPRFLENWGDIPFTYNGSLVALWHSLVATEAFRCCNFGDPNYYFRPPNRIWKYDTLFDTQIPPGTPMGIIYTRGQWSEG
ncbi:MAG: PilX N-terminal domain-containing pilus assembly protein [candidate division NC10 bacterium]|nr:PilX N-terminal domain-containing pilus assembly protein [candidate division NC10 bacterium]